MYLASVATVPHLLAAVVVVVAVARLEQFRANRAMSLPLTTLAARFLKRAQPRTCPQIMAATGLVVQAARLALLVLLVVAWVLPQAVLILAVLVLTATGQI